VRRGRALSTFLLSLGLSVALVAWLLSRIELADLVRTLAGIYLPSLGLYALLSLAGSGLRAYRYRLLIGPERIGSGGIFLVTLIRNLFVDLLPAKLGALSYIYLLVRRFGLSLELGASTFLLAAVFDALSLSPILLLAIFAVGLGTTRLSTVQFFLVALAYRVYSSPVTLLVIQSVVISLGAIPAFWLAREMLRSSFAAVVFALSYLLAPTLEIANLADFHAVAFSSALLLYAFYYAYRRRYAGFFIAAVLGMATKEHVPLSVFVMGLYIAFVQRQTAVGGVTCALAALWAWTAFGVVIPHFNPEGASPYLSRYDQLGKGPLEIVTGLFLNPRGTYELLTEPAKVQYIRDLLSPTLYLALLSPATRSSTWERAVSMSRPIESLAARMAWQTAGPSRPGNIQSTIAASCAPRSAISTPSSPV